MALCLVVEDQPLQRRMIADTLQTAGYQVLDCGTAREGRILCREHRPETVLLDLGLPDADGLDLLPVLLAESPLTRVLVLTGRDSVREAVAALRAGARHYLVKPWDRDELLLVVEREIQAVNLEASRRRSESSSVYWGLNPAMLSLREDLHRLASAPHTAVLLTGETGTGKEVVARELHRLTAPAAAFVATNCAAIPTELLESELFGHEKGAFTGADSRQRGVVELAREGTLFLDEVGELPSHLQAKLLRFLQDGSFRRVGGLREETVTCRVVAATHVDLEQLQAEGRFRSDLYYRLAVVRLETPPLRLRREDLLPLANFLLERISGGLGRPPRPLSPRAEQAVLKHSWPGNVRELANRIERALVLGRGERLEPDDLDLRGAEVEVYPVADDVLDDPSRLRALLDEESWNMSQVARRLGVERHKVKYRVRAHGLKRPLKG